MRRVFIGFSGTLMRWVREYIPVEELADVNCKFYFDRSRDYVLEGDDAPAELAWTYNSEKSLHEGRVSKSQVTKLVWTRWMTFKLIIRLADARGMVEWDATPANRPFGYDEIQEIEAENMGAYIYVDGQLTNP